MEDINNVCRICATVTEYVIPIFSGEGLQNNLADKIHKHLPIQVSEQDTLPRAVCYQCASTLLAWHELVQCCAHADTALRTRTKSKTINVEAGRSTETEPHNKFKEIADFVVQVMDPPQYVDHYTSPTVDRSRICHYCGGEYSDSVFEEHLVAVHAQLLFHCEECDTYVDRKDFILHMSVHMSVHASVHAAVQYSSDGNKIETKSTRKVKIKKDENENTERRESSESPKRPDGGVTRADKVETKNEFSDHSDTEFGFGPLPESVFEAIEDSQDSQPAEENDIPSPAPPRSEDSKEPKLEKIKPHKKARTCPICSKVFTASSSYFYHIKHFHRQSKDHACDICGKKFATKANLVQHGPIHTGECRFECKQCGKRFKSKASHYIHVQTHSDVKKYTCPQCPKTFRWRMHLLRHAKRHAAEKCHVCTVCGRGFSVKCDLLRHARTHAAGNFACDKCGLKFAQLRYLNVHLDRKHSERPAAGDTRQVLED